jgi:hypothetical protein
MPSTEPITVLILLHTLPTMPPKTSERRGRSQGSNDNSEGSSGTLQHNNTLAREREHNQLLQQRINTLEAARTTIKVKPKDLKLANITSLPIAYTLQQYNS